jgi:hypothetical protein
MPVGFGVGAKLFPSLIGLGVQEGERRRRRRKVQALFCLALCGIHLCQLRPLRYLSLSMLVGPYLQVRGFFFFFFFVVLEALLI